MHKDIERIILTEAQIADKVTSLAKEIEKDYRHTVPVLLCILNGAFIFASDLMRALGIDVEIDFMQAASYGDKTFSKGSITILKDATIDLKGRDVLIVEDIADTCITLKGLVPKLEDYGLNSLKLCVLLNKTGVREEKDDVKIDYKGFDIPNEFVVGYGLDYDNLYRNLPYIGILKRRVYTNE
jgi:hypoxanthine phosphoribosyltransferase